MMLSIHPTVALDSNILIYVLDNDSPFFDSARTLLEKLEDSHANVCMSAVARSEILALPYLTSETLGNEARRKLDYFYFINFVPLTKSIADAAAELMTSAGSKLKNVDAIHLATALHYGATEFWTNDRQLAKVNVEGLRIIALKQD
jgi:predicted nucleic acid-binding protein